MFDTAALRDSRNLSCVSMGKKMTKWPKIYYFDFKISRESNMQIFIIIAHYKAIVFFLRAANSVRQTSVHLFF